jgi:hypothetical protein
MKKIVITIQDDICAKNGRDPEATALIEAARSFGKVEPWETAIAAEKATYQAVINNLRTEMEAISENSVTPEELEVLRVIRRKTANETAHYEAVIAERDAQLKSIQAENENRNAQIKSILGIA